MTADLRIVEAQAKLGLPEAKIGAVPGWSGTQRLVRRAGPQAAKRLALLGEIDLRRGGASAWPCGRDVPDRRVGSTAPRTSLAPSPPGRRSRCSSPSNSINAAEGEESAVALEAVAGALAADDRGRARGCRELPREASAATTGTGDGVTSLENEAGRLCSAPLCGVPSPSRRPDPHLATASGKAAIRLRRGEGEDHTVGKGKSPFAVSGRRRS